MNFWGNLNDKKTLTIDIGSRYIRCSIFDEAETLKRYEFESAGIEYGMISNEKAFSKNIEKILEAIILDFNVIPKNVLLTISTTHQNSASLSVVTFTKRADGIITDLDIASIKENARKKIEHLKEKIVLHEIIIRNKIDGNQVLGDIRKIKGAKIESKVLFVYDDLHNYKLLNKIFKTLGVEIDRILSGPLIEAEMLLSDKEKRLGAAVINLGYHVSTLCVYERGSPLIVSCLNYGGEHITSEIALTLKLDLDSAESAKINMALKDYSRRKCEELIENSIYNFSDKINLELDRIKRRGLLPAGIRLTGNTARLNKIESYFKYDLGLPSINTYFDPRYIDVRDDLNFIKNINTNNYSDNINDVDIYRAAIKNNYLKIQTIFKRFLP